MTQVPTNRTAASSIAEHTSDHNVFAAQHNGLDGHTVDAAAHAAAIAAAIAALVAAAPATLDTLNELAAALGNDANYAATITTALGGKSATGHGHAESDVTSLVSDLAAKLATAAHTKAAHDALALSHDSLADVSADDHHAQAHHAAHEPSGADPMAVDAAAATGSLRTIGSGAAQAAAGNHAHSGSYVVGSVTLTVASSAPGSPTTNDLWVDTT